MLKDLCGGVEMATSRKYGHLIRFETTFHVLFLANSDQALKADPNDIGMRKKRVGYRMVNRFAAEGDSVIDNVTVFADEKGVRNLIGDRYWISMLRFLHARYQEVLQRGFSQRTTEYRMDFPAPSEARGMDYYVNLFEVYDPPRGSLANYSMEELYQELNASHNLDMSEHDFYNSSFKVLLQQKIMKTFRALHGMPDSMQGGPRYKPPRSGSARFYGVRLLDDARDAGEDAAAGS
jgi:hypothetical protein